MSDDLSNRGPADRARVNVHEAHELRYWTKHFNCTADQLKAAVAKVGVMVTNVTKELSQTAK